MLTGTVDKNDKSIDKEFDMCVLLFYLLLSLAG